jgi:hypothetical protein
LAPTIEASDGSVTQFEASRANYTISSGDTVATLTADVQATIALATAKSAGKHYADVVITGSFSPDNCIFGIGTSGNANYPGSYAVSWGYDGTTQYSSGVTGLTALNRPSVTNGDVVSLALDLDDRKAWIGINNAYASSGNPAAGTNATYTWTSTHALTFVFRPFYSSSVLTLPSTLLYLPSGFTRWS